MKYVVLIWLVFLFIDISGQGKQILIGKIKGEHKEEDSLKQFKQDIEFAQFIYEMNLLEIELAKLASTSDSVTKVIHLAQKLMEDHAILNADLEKLAEKKKIILPVVLSEKKRKVYNRLASINDSRFNKKYLDLVIKNHVEMIDRVRKELNGGNDPEMKAWAEEKLPMLEEHLKMAKKVQGQLQGKAEYGVSFTL